MTKDPELHAAPLSSHARDITMYSRASTLQMVRMKGSQNVRRSLPLETFRTPSPGGRHSDLTDSGDDEPDKIPLVMKQGTQNSGFVYLSIMLASGFGNSMLSCGNIFSRTGVVPGIIWMVIMLFITKSTALFLIRTADVTHVFNLKSQIDKVFTPTGRMLAHAGLFLYGCFFLAGDLVVVQEISYELISSHISDHSLLHHKIILSLLTMLFIILPLTFISLTALSKIGGIAIAFNVLLFLLLLSRGLSEGKVENLVWWPQSIDGMITGFSGSALYFNSHLIAGMFYGTLEHRTYAKMNSLLAYGAFTEFGCISAAGISALSAFGIGIEGNVLASFDGQSITGFLVRIGQIVTSILIYVQVTHPILGNFICCLPRRIGNSKLISILLIQATVFTLLVSLSDLQSILTFAGCTVAVVVTFCLPCLIILKVSEIRPFRHLDVLADVYRAKWLLSFGLSTSLIGLYAFFKSK